MHDDQSMKYRLQIGSPNENSYIHFTDIQIVRAVKQQKHCHVKTMETWKLCMIGPMGSQDFSTCVSGANDKL